MRGGAQFIKQTISAADCASSLADLYCNIGNSEYSDRLVCSEARCSHVHAHVITARDFLLLRSIAVYLHCLIRRA